MTYRTRSSFTQSFLKLKSTYRPTNRLYIHDDLADLKNKYANNLQVVDLIDQLQELILENSNSEFINVESQIQNLVKKMPTKIFSQTLGLGSSGENIANDLQAITGQFMNVKRIDIRRVENQQNKGKYDLVSKSGVPFSEQLSGINTKSIAIVDDTLYSGLTIETILQNLPKEVLKNTYVFCLRGMSTSVRRLEKYVGSKKIFLGFSAKGRFKKNFGFIIASGLFIKGSIRNRKDGELAFFQRLRWIKMWFPKNYRSIAEICLKLNTLIN